MTKRAFCLLLIFLLVGCAGRTPPTEIRRIAIFCTSDLQSDVAGTEHDRDGRKQTLGGLARIAAVAGDESRNYDGTLLLSSGDDMIGSFYELYKGEPEMTGMTLAGYRAACPGNHEFDYGLKTYDKALAHAGFDVLCANLSSADPAFSQKVMPYAVYDVAGVRIGVFGLITPDLFRLTRPEPELSLNRDFETAARNCVAELRQKGCRVVVALSHMGVALDSRLAENVPGIDFIVGGHDHILADTVLSGTRIVQDAAEGTHLGVLSFTFQDGAVRESSFRAVLLDDARGSNPKVAAAMDLWLEKYHQGLGTPIGILAAGLDTTRKTVRGGEAAAGDLVADSWLAWFPDARASLVNGGSIRGDRVIPAGTVTYETVNSMLPFGNDILSVTLTGRDLLQVLEISASALGGPGDDPDADPARTPTGGFLQVGGIQMTLDLSRRPFRAGEKGEVLFAGERVIQARIRQKDSYEDIDPAKTYTVLVSDFTASGGDGYFVFGRPGVLRTNTTMKPTALLADYIRKHSPVTPKKDGRIKLLEGNSF
ncbi:MAG: bifunctional UDP-sugar hydrolase/5'-nucleotidase [Thermodesulfobacteriota bacterium]